MGPAPGGEGGGEREPGRPDSSLVGRMFKAFFLLGQNWEDSAYVACRIHISNTHIRFLNICIFPLAIYRYNIC